MLFLLTYFIVGGSYLVLQHLVLPRAEIWRPGLEQALTERLGQPVRIGSLDARFDAGRPTLLIESLRIGPTDAGIAFDSAELVLSWRSLLEASVRFARIRLDIRRVRLERRGDGSVSIAGLDLGPAPDAASAASSTTGSGAIDWLLSQREVRAQVASVSLSDQATGRQVLISGLELRLGTVGRRHRIGLDWRRMDADDGHRIGATRLALEVFRAPDTLPSDLAAWTGACYLKTEAADVAALSMLPGSAHWPVSGGIADLELRFELNAGQLRDARARLVGRDIVWRADPGGIRPRALEVDLRASARPPSRYEVVATHLSAVDSQGNRIETGAREQRLLLEADGSVRELAISLARIDVADVLRVARAMPLPEESQKSLAQIEAGGVLEALSVKWRQAENPGIDVDASFAGLSFRDRRKPRPGRAGVPGFSGLDGRVRFNRDGGELSVRSSAAVLRFPGVFDDPDIRLDRVAGDIAWSLGPEEPDGRTLQVRVGDISFANADVAGDVTGSYRSGGRGVGIFDLTGRLTRAQAARVWRYLPRQIAPETRQWIRRSITAGRASDVDFVLRGDLWEFPFRNPRDGLFRVSAKLADTTLDYAPKWPLIDRIDGTLVFERAGMHIHVGQGRSAGLALEAVDARIDDFREPVLRIDGRSQGAAQAMVAYVNGTPLATRIDDFTRDTRVQGNAALRLALELPLGNLVATRVAGEVRFAGNDLVLDSTLPPFRAVSGRLEFSERGLALHDIHAGFLGGQVQVAGTTPAPGKFELRANGDIPASGIRSVADNALTRRLSGSTAYTARISVNRRASTLSIDSDLVGLEARLPAPFSKSADAALPLRVRSRPEGVGRSSDRPRRDRLDVSLGADVKLAFERERDPRTDRLGIRRGVLAVRAEPELPRSGLAVKWQAERVDLDAWRELIDRMRGGTDQHASGTGGFSIVPSTVSISTPELLVSGKRLHDVVFGASRLEGRWQANVSAREIEGRFSWKDKAPGQPLGAVVARFKRLEIPRNQASEIETLLDRPPEDLPALDIAADEFVLAGHSLGSLVLNAHHAAKGGDDWRIETLRIVNPDANFEATGRWGAGRVPRPVSLEFALRFSDAGRMLARLGFPDTLKGGSGQFHGSASWSGSPLSIDFPSLAGSMTLDAGRGQFLRSEPGIAKLIGVLSLQSLRRRLTLDFSDVFAKGFAFDRIAGDVDIAAGVARTRNLRMAGVQAEVGIVGEADLVRETQKLEVTVLPDLNAGIASLAYAAIANPGVGLGSFLAQMLLRKPLAEVFGTQFGIEGSWSDPTVVERVRETAPANPIIQ
ncbi:MAG: TIGR02099 family protein [Burkholderiaceae bacterium]|nr:TIGR02099 family protein [Burkholderiaceae bacterium]